MEALLEMAKVTSKGQVTIPISIRRMLGVREGDKVLFTEEPDGTVTMRNATLNSLRAARAAFAGAADEAGLTSEDDVVDMVSAIRKERAGL